MIGHIAQQVAQGLVVPDPLGPGNLPEHVLEGLAGAVEAGDLPGAIALLRAAGDDADVVFMRLRGLFEIQDYAGLQQATRDAIRTLDTSRVAPAMWPERISVSRSGSATWAPRATLIR